MQGLGKGLRQAIGQCLHHDLGIVVVGALESARDVLLADASGHGEAADIIAQARLLRRHEIGEREVRPARIAGHLLTERMQGGEGIPPCLIRVKLDVVADAVRRPEADHGVGRQPFLLDELFQHRLRVLEQRPRRLAVFVVLQDARVLALQLPGLEERRPIDIAGELGEIVGLERPRAEESRLRRRIAGPVELERIGAGLRERGARLFRLAACIGLGHARIFFTHLGDLLRPLLFRHEARDDTHGAAGIGHVDGLAARVVRADLDGGMHAARGGPADQERQVEAFALHLRRDVAHLVERRRDET